MKAFFIQKFHLHTMKLMRRSGENEYANYLRKKCQSYSVLHFHLIFFWKYWERYYQNCQLELQLYSWNPTVLDRLFYWLENFLERLSLLCKMKLSAKFNDGAAMRTVWTYFILDLPTWGLQCCSELGETITLSYSKWYTSLEIAPRCSEVKG